MWFQSKKCKNSAKVWNKKCSDMREMIFRFHSPYKTYKEVCACGAHSRRARLPSGNTYLARECASIKADCSAPVALPQSPPICAIRPVGLLAYIGLPDKCLRVCACKHAHPCSRLSGLLFKKWAPWRTLAPSAVAVRQHSPYARVRINVFVR